MMILQTTYSGYRAKIQTTCKNLNTVRRSTQSAQMNVNLGGHIWQHVYGLGTNAPTRTASGDTQLNKTLFKNGADFLSAWRALTGSAGCSRGNRDLDCVSASTLGISLAYRCIAVDSRNLCTRKSTFTPTFVEFHYYRNSNGWILRTAFPTRRSCPSG